MSFAGKNAVTANKHKLSIAQQRLEAGVDGEAVRRETGWHCGVDGKMRFEISDDDAKIKMPFPEKNQPFGEIFDAVYRDNISNGNFDGIKVGDILNHPNLFSAYPSLADISIATQDIYGAAFEHKSAVNPSTIPIGKGVPMYEVKSRLLHELQHAIQDHEAFASGGNAEQSGIIGLENKLRIEELRVKVERLQNTATDTAAAYIYQADSDSEKRDYVDRAFNKWANRLGTRTNDNPYGVDRKQAVQFELLEHDAAFNSMSDEYNKLFKMGVFDPDDIYKRLAGEVEARNTQFRLKMTAEQRQSIPPSKTQDVPDRDVILTINGKVILALDQSIHQRVNATLTNIMPSTQISALNQLAQTAEIAYKGSVLEKD